MSCKEILKSELFAEGAMTATGLTSLGAGIWLIRDSHFLMFLFTLFFVPTAMLWVGVTVNQ